MKTWIAVALCCAAIVFAAEVQAHWEIGDGHKMHFPQLPDPQGWDVDITERWVADDWQCSWTGPVDDIHIWVSWFEGAPSEITNLHVEIWSNDPGSAVGYSHPLAPLWASDFAVTPDMIAGPWPGDQGYYLPNPTNPLVVEDDHTEYWQINLDEIDSPFTQVEGEVYWLVLNAEVSRSSNEFASLGWKTSQSNFMDTAVYALPPGTAAPEWIQLPDPPALDTYSTDMAFVITPEPASLAALAAGALALLRRRR